MDCSDAGNQRSTMGKFWLCLLVVIFLALLIESKKTKQSSDAREKTSNDSSRKMSTWEKSKSSSKEKESKTKSEKLSNKASDKTKSMKESEKNHQTNRKKTGNVRTPENKTKFANFEEKNKSKSNSIKAVHQRTRETINNREATPNRQNFRSARDIPFSKSECEVNKEIVEKPDCCCDSYGESRTTETSLSPDIDGNVTPPDWIEEKPSVKQAQVNHDNESARANDCISQTKQASYASCEE